MLKQYVIALVITSTVMAAGNDAVGPQFKTVKAKAAQTRYRMAFDAAQREYSSKLEAARIEYLRSLHEAMADATRAANLREANTINEEIRRQQGGAKGRINIIAARFGAWDSYMDVTGRVRELLAGNPTSLHVDTRSMGGDPAPGKYKTLVVVYQLDDQPHLQLIKDTGDWQLPETNK